MLEGGELMAIGRTNVGGGGGGSGLPTAEANDVNFYDFDGSIRYSYTASEALALTALPDLPDHSGNTVPLTGQRWNWALADMQSYISTYGKCNVRATYITADGKTHLHIRIAAEGRMNVPLYFSQTVTNGVTIDWGDGSSTQKLTGIGNRNTAHTYSSVGDYDITLAVESGCVLGLGANSSSYCVLGVTSNNGRVYCNMLQEVNIGERVTSIGTYAFNYCASLASITIPNSVTSIGNYAFAYCYSLASITIPNSVTSIGISAFYFCYSLAGITIPNGVASIGGNTFYNCYSLASITIPNSVTSIGTYAFKYCYGMAIYDFSTHTSVPTLAATNAFDGIPSGCIMKIPSALFETWKTATNWSTYAAYMVAV